MSSLDRKVQLRLTARPNVQPTFSADQRDSPGTLASSASLPMAW
jgi:hypothetical protein